MKKLLSLTLLLFLGVACSFAQDETEYTRKTWDFTQGWSDETKADLIADAANWATNRTDANTGEVTGWKDAKKLPGILSANGKVIKELDGISFGTAGLSSSNNILLDPTSIRISRTNMEFTLKTKVKAGQTITLEYKSANGTATDRGFHCTTPGVTLTQGEEIALGANGWEGNPRVWTVDASVTEPIEVTFKAQPAGGLDIRLIMIDQGDEPEVEDAAKVAFLYDTRVNGYDLDNDYAYVALASSSSVEVTAIDIATEEITREGLMNDYEVVVNSQSIRDNAVLKSLVAFTPMLQIGSLYYSAYGWGQTVAAGANTAIAIPEGKEEGALFDDLPVEDGMLDFGVPVGGVTLGDYFANDEVVATVGDAVAIHIHNAKRNAYMMLPAAIAQSEVALQMIPNAINVLKGTKKAEGACAAPTISQEYGNGYTTVTLKASGTIVYTTDGTDPTEASAVYTEPIVLTEACTVKAMAMVDGYLNSKVASADVVIKSQTAVPSISIDKQAGKSIVTISGEGTIYYNYQGVTSKTASGVYAEAIEVTYPCEITAFAEAEGCIASEVATAQVEVDGVTVRENPLVTPFLAQKETYHEEESANATGKLNYYFSWNKSGQSCWDEANILDQYTVTGSEGQDSIVYVYGILPEEIFAPEGAPWVIASSGQVMNWSSDAPTNDNVGDESNRNPAAPEDAGTVSKANVTFGKITGTATANIRTAEKVAGPFDVVAFVGNGNGSSQPILEIQISADGTTWTKLADVNMYPVRRCYKKTRASYNETTPVFVRIKDCGKATNAMIYEINIYGDGEDVSAIEKVANNAAKAVNAIYNLAGQKVSAGYKGIVIKNGKKYMVK